jgi:hypothetical protein
MAPTAIKAFLTAVKGIAGPVTAVITVIASLSSSYGGLGGVLERIGQLISDVTENVKKFAKAIGMDGVINRLKTSLGKLSDAFGKVYDALGKLKPI